MTGTRGTLLSIDCIDVLRMDGSFLFAVHKTFPSVTFGPWLKGATRVRIKCKIFISDFRQALVSKVANTSHRNETSVAAPVEFAPRTGRTLPKALTLWYILELAYVCV